MGAGAPTYASHPKHICGKPGFLGGGGGKNTVLKRINGFN